MGKKSSLQPNLHIASDLRFLATPVQELRQLPGNPRIGDVDAVAKSLSAFGQRKPIVARQDGVVIAGNHTLQAAIKLGWLEIAVVRVDDDDATAHAYALADNRTAELGQYDDNLLLALVDRIKDDEQLFAASGWTQDDLSALIDAASTGSDLEPLVDPDDVPEIKQPVSVPGDLWLLGPHRVLCGDSTAITDVERLCVNQVDMVWTDPPYGVSYVGGTKDALTILNDDLDINRLETFLASSLGNASIISKPGATWFVAAPPGPLFLAFGKVLLNEGIWRQTLVWLKSALVMGRSDYHYRHESIFYGWKPGAAHTPPPDRKQDTIWQFDKPQRNADHPTMKPVALVERAIINHTKPDHIIFDPFGGSGTTLIAAHGCGRQARLLELDPQYVDVICTRFQKATGILPILEASGEAHDFLS